MTPDAVIEARVVEAVPEPLAKVGPRAIGPIFGRTRHWFERGHVRRQLAAQGFPSPISRGVWLKRDVVRFALRRSAGLPTAAPAIADAAAAEDLGEVMRRTRQHLEHRRTHKGRASHG